MLLCYVIEVLFFFFFQAEDGIRDYKVTGVQTCALPISSWRSAGSARPRAARSNVPPPAERSAPAQNARPAPVTITARTVSSASAASKASTSSPSVVAVTALSFSGRASVTSATPSATPYPISAKPIAARASGAEEPDAEIFAGARRGGRPGPGGRRRELLELG